MAEGDYFADQHIWVPDISRQLLIDESNPSLMEFADRASGFLSENGAPRLYLFTQRESLELDYDAALAVNLAIDSKLPGTIIDELDVLTTGIRVATRYRSKRYLTLQLADARLAQERQPILDAAYESYGKLPRFFKDFRLEVVWGPVRRGVDITSLPNDLEDARPGIIKLKPAHINRETDYT